MPKDKGPDLVVPRTMGVRMHRRPSQLSPIGLSDFTAVATGDPGAGVGQVWAPVSAVTKVAPVPAEDCPLTTAAVAVAKVRVATAGLE